MKVFFLFSLRFRNFFNWSWSYKKKSDVYDPYGYRIQSGDLEVSDYWKPHNLPIHDMTE